MTIEVSYRFSHLDKTHCFGIVVHDAENWETYVRWVWYHMGEKMGKVPKNFRLYPYNYESKILKTYKNCNDAERQATLLVNKIHHQLKK